MKNSLLFVLAILLVFGCAGPSAPSNATEKTPSLPIPIAQPEKPSPCNSDYSFSEISNGVLSKTTKFVATVFCAGNKTMAVKIDGQAVDSRLVESDASSILEFNLAPRKDGVVKLSVESDGAVVFSKDWTVASLGNPETKGMENDAVSFKEWRAMAFDAENPFAVGRIRMYLKRLDDRTQPGTNILVEIRNDNRGVPGALVSAVRRPITVTTLSDNWINFDFTDAPELAAGRYWVVLKIEQTENVRLVSDVVNLHYVTVNKESVNDYTKQMFLAVDSKTSSASETEWTPLPYDKVYSMTIHGAK